MDAYLSLNVPDASGNIVCLGTVEDADVVSQVARVVLGKGMVVLQQVSEIIGEECDHEPAQSPHE